MQEIPSANLPRLSTAVVFAHMNSGCLKGLIRRCSLPHMSTRFPGACWPCTHPAPPIDDSYVFLFGVMISIQHATMKGSDTSPCAMYSLLMLSIQSSK
ncbi:hypothetical protein BDN70DRAFT_611491 [Pholiota conissans]|uniref:Uncharacterized protein n=1 Tax=Pholiota conissans TaxID=109636 RepID=A0A9P5Z3F9_9AGAR|nr:hypothetical protein BDN70DRAFT_611491 [Pholiota conissans]